jgi:hypothetical protein
MVFASLTQNRKEMVGAPNQPKKSKISRFDKTCSQVGSKLSSKNINLKRSL